MCTNLNLAFPLAAKYDPSDFKASKSYIEKFYLSNLGFLQN
jgi:hypothetical protein